MARSVLKYVYALRVPSLPGEIKTGMGECASVKRTAMLVIVMLHVRCSFELTWGASSGR